MQIGSVSFSRVSHRHNSEAVKYRLNRFNWINFSDNDVSAETFCTHCRAFAAPTVTCNDDVFTCYNQICGAHNSFPRRLTRTVAIVEKIFAISVVSRDNRERKFAASFKRTQSVNAGCSFFRAAENFCNCVTAFGMKKVNNIAAVINYKRRREVNGFIQIIVVLFICASVFGKNRDTTFNERGGNVILS